ncbi:MAG: hypothetical protein BGO77_05865 [Caedibacter sp. 37-49]|nr:MAG: hypothetical protein BGO77_05865 [Caedibacter sp. 37-49]
MKVHRLLFFILFCSQIALSTPSQDLEEVSIYSPNGRFGFNGSIVDITLENVQSGPQDKYFSLDNERRDIPTYIPRGLLVFKKDTQWNFDNSEGRGDPKLDKPVGPELSAVINHRISTYGIARLTLDSFLECGVNTSSFNTLKVIFNPDDRACRLGIGNAYYERINRPGIGRIELCGAINNQTPLPTARFFDIVSHETGHSILDALNAYFYGHRSNSPLAAFHESFADLSTFFASLRLAKIHEKDDEVVHLLSNSNISLCLALNFDGRGHCLRNSIDVNASCESHDNSRKFTNFYLKSMREVFTHYPQTSDNAYWVVNYFQKLLVQSVVSVRTVNSLYDMGTHVVQQIPLCGGLADNGINLVSTILIKQLAGERNSLQSCVVNQSAPAPLPNVGNLRLNSHQYY